MVSEELQRFYDDNPLLYGRANPEDLDQLSSICELYPDSARLLTDREAVELPHFECRRCGACCAAVKYVTVSHGDVKRWVSQKRLDILRALVIDKRRTPLLAMKKKAIGAAKDGARSLLESAGLDSEHAFELLYVTTLLECAVYVKRRDGACAFLAYEGSAAACGIQGTKPLVCEKFPYYMGKYTDGRLLKEDSFCPSLSEYSRGHSMSTFTSASPLINVGAWSQEYLTLSEPEKRR
jgi:Fe-S-cluster containining protein